MLAFDDYSGKCLGAYKDSNSNGGIATVLGISSGTTISAGATETFIASNNPWALHIDYDSNANKFAIFWTDISDGYKGKACTATIAGNGTDVSFGTVMTFSGTDDVRQKSAAFDPDTNKFLVAWENNTDTAGEAAVATISGTDISFGTTVVIQTDSFAYVDVGYDQNVNKFLVAFADSGDSSKLKNVVGTISGTDVCFVVK